MNLFNSPDRPPPCPPAHHPHSFSIKGLRLFINISCSINDRLFISFGYCYCCLHLPWNTRPLSLPLQSLRITQSEIEQKTDGVRFEIITAIESYDRRVRYRLWGKTAGLGVGVGMARLELERCEGRRNPFNINSHLNWIQEKTTSTEFYCYKYINTNYIDE